MNQPTPEQILQQQARHARAARAQQQVEAQEAESSRQQYQVRIIDFDASQGFWMCQLPDGTILPARKIDYWGSAGSGDLVVLTKDRDGGTATIKSKP